MKQQSHENVINYYVLRYVELPGEKAKNVQLRTLNYIWTWRIKNCF